MSEAGVVIGGPAHQLTARGGGPGAQVVKVVPQVTIAVVVVVVVDVVVDAAKFVVDSLLLGFISFLFSSVQSQQSCLG